MLLSEAILKGSEGRGQCTGAYELPDGRVCVIGAIAKALSMGNIDTDKMLAKIIEGKGLGCSLVHLNDDRKYTFKQIVDYIKEKNLDVTI